MFLGGLDRIFCISLVVVSFYFVCAVKLKRRIKLRDKLLVARLCNSENTIVRRDGEYTLNLIRKAKNTDDIHIDVSPVKNSPAYKRVGMTPEIWVGYEVKEWVVEYFDTRLLAGHLKNGGKIGKFK